MDNRNKKITIYLSILFVSLLVLGIGLTYAYFNVTTTNSFGTKTIVADVEGTGSVTVTGQSVSLTMALNQADMMQENAGTSYFASNTGKKTYNHEEVLGIASVSPSSDETYYHCTYTLQISHTGTNDMYNKFTNNYANKSAEQIKLIVNHQRYDWNSGMPTEVEGDFYITGGDNQEITAGLQFINSRTINQDGLQGTDVNVTVTIKNNTLHCDIVENPYAILLPGPDLNIKMKQIAEPNNASNITAASYNNTNVTSIQKYSGTPSASVLTSDHEVQDASSNSKIYVWFDNGTLYYYSPASVIKANTTLKNGFQRFENLVNISGLQYIDTSNVTILQSAFAGSISLTNLSPLSNWDVSNVASLSKIFAGTYNVQMSLADLTPLSYWNIGSVTNMQAMFSCNTSLLVLNGLENWNTSTAQDMRGIFGCDNLVNMHIANIDALLAWNVSSVNNMSVMFQRNDSITSINSLRKWNVSSVNNFSNTFAYMSGLVNLNGLQNWNVQSANNMQAMFAGTSSLDDASAINDWNVTGVTNFTGMFEGSKNGIHPEWTRVTGTWSNGTFTKTT
jgi:surface protein